MTTIAVSEKKEYRHLALIAGGSFLLVLALLISGNMIEEALLTDLSRSLSWGPALFRGLLAFHGIVLLAAGIIGAKQRRAGRRHSREALEATRGHSRKMSAASWIFLVILSLLALALRLWRLDTDLWFDEILTLLDFARLPMGEIVTRFPNQNQHMLFSILAHTTISIFGESAWALRLPSVVFGVGSLWALFLLGRRVLGVLEAILACTLMTVSYHHIWFSQNARGYMGLLFFATLATWLWLEAVSRDRWGWWVGYALALAFGMWIHMTTVFVAAAHFLIYLSASVLRPREKLRLKPIAAWILSATLTVQLLALSLPEILQKALHEVSLESEWTNPLWVITESLKSLQIGFSGIAVVAVGAGMALLGWASIVRRDRRAGIAIVLPAVLAGSTMLVLGHNLWPRFFFFSMGFALLIAVHGAMTAPRFLLGRVARFEFHDRLTAGAGAALTSLIILASSVTIPRCYALPKQDYTGTRDYVERVREQGDAVVAVGLAGRAYGQYFAPGWSVAQTQAELDTIRSHASNVWLVYTIPIQVKAYCPDVWDAIERDFEVVKVFPGTLGGGELYVCRQRARIW